MNIRKPKSVKKTAAQMLSRAPMKNKIMLIYCALVLAACILTTGANYFLDYRMGQAGGLGNLGVRTVLSTFQTIAPMLHSVALMILDMGLLGAMLRISRGQYTSPQTLRLGLARFWPMLRFSILQIALYLALALAALNVAMIIFFMTPLATDTVSLLEPVVATATDAQAAVDALLADSAFISDFMLSVAPVYVVFLVVYLALVIPLNYRLGVAHYVLLDDPTAGALRAISESFRMTRRNCMAFFKLDLSFWWYYLLTALVTAVSYGDMLPLQLPIDKEVLTLLFYGLYLIAQTAIYYFFRPQLEVSTALIYDTIRPKEEEQNGVVLGNIFQM